MKKAIECAPVYQTPDLKSLVQHLEQESTDNIWLIDERFKSKVNAKRVLSFTANERLKELSHFSEILPQILNLASGLNRNQMQIIALGGGSLGDFAGFIASVLKRGVKLCHIPTTYLSAMDSAHGGKTALNLGKYKNQIGSFYPAQKIFLVEEILNALPKELIADGKAELIKIALLKDKNLLLKLDDFWPALLRAIELKYDYIEKDPREISGLRSELNLGHTYAHILELCHGLSHGKAVGQGLHIAVNWSLKKSYLSLDTANYIKDVLNTNSHPYLKLKIAKEQAENILLQDKKMQADKAFRFIFLSDIAKPRTETVSAKDFIYFLEEEDCLK